MLRASGSHLEQIGDRDGADGAVEGLHERAAIGGVALAVLAEAGRDGVVDLGGHDPSLADLRMAENKLVVAPVVAPTVDATPAQAPRGPRVASGR
ncbi:MAG: hypothetical protein U5R31_11810 [Acidimicrobiia bacterium]|nr:hypothetical protein [Acidimicrobiia bacterium]